MAHTNILFFLIIPLVWCRFHIRNTKQNAIEEKVVLSMRAMKALEMIRTKSCTTLTATDNCTSLKSRLPHEMHMYAATPLHKHSKLDVRLVRKHGGSFNGLHAVVIIDPFPETYFGHTILVMLVKQGLSEGECENNNGLSYIQVDRKPECMFIPDTTKCIKRNKVTNKEEKRICSINHIPFVYDTSDVHRTSRLECRSNIQGFGRCQLVDEELSGETRCKNSQRCSLVDEFGTPTSPCHWNCDYAILLSGGWNKFMNKPRHLRNIHDMYHYLRNKGRFRKENIKIFFANNATIDLDGNRNTQDIYPATESTGVLNHMEYVCAKSRQCIDTLVLYLNCPTLKGRDGGTGRGDMLLWDHNNDGSYSNTEVIRLVDLLKPLSKCGAKNYIIIADQNYAGTIIQEVEKGRIAGRPNFNRIHVITATSAKSLSRKRSFTKNFISFDNLHLDARVKPDNTLNVSDITAATRRLSDIYKDLKSKLSRKYHVRYLPGDDTNLTVSGTFGQPAGCSANIIPNFKDREKEMRMGEGGV